jgi:hypothetical protein
MIKTRALGLEASADDSANSKIGSTLQRSPPVRSITTSIHHQFDSYLLQFTAHLIHCPIRPRSAG